MFPLENISHLVQRNKVSGVGVEGSVMHIDNNWLGGHFFLKAVKEEILNNGKGVPQTSHCLTWGELGPCLSLKHILRRDSTAVNRVLFLIPNICTIRNCSRWHQKGKSLAHKIFTKARSLQRSLRLQQATRGKGKTHLPGIKNRKRNVRNGNCFWTGDPALPLVEDFSCPHKSVTNAQGTCLDCSTSNAAVTHS